MSGQYYTLYEGPSVLDGAPVVVVAYVGSKNKKTVGMIETYVLVQAVEPNEAANQGLDASVCGGCAFRRVLAQRQRAKTSEQVANCYVNLPYGPRTAWQAWRAGKAPTGTLDVLCQLLPVRVGSYGDPGAVPFSVWAPLLHHARAQWTGYTHQWANPRIDPQLQNVCMASVDTLAQHKRAKKAGWRTFRVRQWKGETPEAKTRAEATCPASKEAGKVTTCLMCRMCSGLSSDAPDICTIDHGHSTRALWERNGERVIAEEQAHAKQAAKKKVAA